MVLRIKPDRKKSLHVIELGLILPWGILDEDIVSFDIEE